MNKSGLAAEYATPSRTKGSYRPSGNRCSPSLAGHFCCLRQALHKYGLGMIRSLSRSCTRTDHPRFLYGLQTAFPEDTQETVVLIPTPPPPPHSQSHSFCSLGNRCSYILLYIWELGAKEKRLQPPRFKERKRE